MFLIYYDEVKHYPPTQPAQLFGGIAIEAQYAQEIENKLNDLAEKFFGNSLLSRETEFHAKEIFQAKGNFKGWKPEARLEVVSDLLDVLGDERVFKLYARLTPERLHFPCDPERHTFMLFVEKAEEFLRAKKQIGMLFGDYDQKMISPSVTNLSQYRQGQTSWALGRKIERLVDTVYFTHSHHSRMVQLADTFVYCTQYLNGDNSSHWRKKFEDKINSKYASLRPTKYRDYPNTY